MSGNDRTTPYEERVETWKGEGEGSSSTLSFSLLVPSRFFFFSYFNSSLAILIMVELLLPVRSLERMLPFHTSCYISPS